MRTHLGAVSVSLCLLSACSSVQPRLMPELTHLDVERPYMIYPPVVGTGCGDNALSIAVNDLLATKGAHGFIGAVLEQDKRPEREDCLVITARPFTYGCDVQTLGPRPAEPNFVPGGPTQCTPTGEACDEDCTAYASHLGGSEFQTSAVKNRCITRCQNNDATFMTCARAATTPDAVRACDASN